MVWWAVMAACFIDDGDLALRLDGDLDGEASEEVGGGDCDDGDPAVSPQATEVLDGRDEDCSGRVDDLDWRRPSRQWWGSDHLAHLGGSVASGDVDGDGEVELWISERGADSGGTAGVGLVQGWRPDGGAPIGTVSGEAETPAIGAHLQVQDFDADGFADVLLSSREGSSVWLMTGPITGEVSTSEARWWLEHDDLFGQHALGPMVDLDGDASPDVILGLSVTAVTSVASGGLLVFPGPVSGYRSDLSDALALVGSTEGEEAGAALATADLTGDGFVDVVVGAPGANDDSGRFYVLSGPVSAGGAQRLDVQGIVFDGPEGSSMGAALDALDGPDGDLDGDGYADLLVGLPTDLVADQGAVSVFYGPLTSSSVADARVLGEQETAPLGTDCSFVGDLTGRGDVAISIGAPRSELSAYEAGAAWLVMGADLDGSVEIEDLDGPRVVGTETGAALGASSWVGDLDADGDAEWVLSAPWAAVDEVSVGTLLLYRSAYY